MLFFSVVETGISAVEDELPKKFNNHLFRSYDFFNAMIPLHVNLQNDHRGIKTANRYLSSSVLQI